MLEIKFWEQKYEILNKFEFIWEMVQQVLEYREFDYRDPRNTRIFLMVTIE